MAVTPSTTAKQLLAREVAASVQPTLDDADLSAALVMFAVVDGGGVLPGATGWLETYDLNGAAAKCWGWKAAKASSTVSIGADGQQVSLSHIVANCLAQQALFEHKRQTGTISVLGLG